MTWSALPEADLKETDDDELDRLISQVRVIADKETYERVQELTRYAHEFNRQLFAAKLHHQQVRNEGRADDSQSMQQRMSLGTIAEKLVESHKQVEAAIRRDMEA